MPMVSFYLLVFVWPVISFLLLSFGSDISSPSLEHYEKIFQTSIYSRILYNTFSIAACVTIISVIFSYPIVYLLINVSERMRRLLFIVVLLPFWTSALVRTTAWIVILQRNGILNDLLMSSGITAEPISFVYNFSGVLIGMTHVMMPFIVFPLYASYKDLDYSLIEAAESLGSKSLQITKRIILPLTMPGVIAGSIIVFMSSIGYYITPALMGGPGQTMIAMLIENNINQTLNWEMAASLSVILLLVTLMLFIIFQKYFGFDKLLTSNIQKGSRKNFTQSKSSVEKSIMYLSLIHI